MDVLEELENFINEFNKHNDEDFNIDTIRIEFSKQHKINSIEQLGNWKKINKNDRRILSKLKERLTVDEITTAHQLEKHNIYYYNQVDKIKKYRKATMVIFGMKQYHKSPPPKELMKNLLDMLVYGTSKVLVNIDVCSDTAIKPHITNLEQHFKLKQYVEPITQTPTETYYINDPKITMIEKLVIYNKRIKNNLNFNVWRVEALMHIPNIRCLALPLHELKQITDITKGRL